MGRSQIALEVAGLVPSYDIVHVPIRAPHIDKSCALCPLYFFHSLLLQVMVCVVTPQQQTNSVYHILAWLQ